MRKGIKRSIKTMAAACIAALMMASTAFAAGWVQQQGTGRWWYDLGNGQYYAAGSETPRWEWLDGNRDGIAECYAFDREGWMYASTQTPDGYTVDRDGAWVVNGTVQTMAVAAGHGGTLGQVQGPGQTAGQGAAQEQAQSAAQTQAAEEGKILIAYFSHTGTTEAAARQIQEVTGGDLFEIRTVNAYPNTYQAAVDMAKRELDSQARPALSTQVSDMASYDTILLGYPIWWHTTPMAINTFLESYDLSGKTILPFCTSGGSSVEESMSAVRASAGRGNVGTGLTANSVSRQQIISWLQANGI